MLCAVCCVLCAVYCVLLCARYLVADMSSDPASAWRGLVLTRTHPRIPTCTRPYRRSLPHLHESLWYVASCCALVGFAFLRDSAPKAARRRHRTRAPPRPGPLRSSSRPGSSIPIPSCFARRERG